MAFQALSPSFSPFPDYKSVTIGIRYLNLSRHFINSLAKKKAPKISFKYSRLNSQIMLYVTDRSTRFAKSVSSTQLPTNVLEDDIPSEHRQHQRCRHE